MREKLAENFWGGGRGKKGKSLASYATSSPRPRRHASRRCSRSPRFRCGVHNLASRHLPTSLGLGTNKLVLCCSKDDKVGIILLRTRHMTFSLALLKHNTKTVLPNTLNINFYITSLSVSKVN